MKKILLFLLMNNIIISNKSNSKNFLPPKGILCKWCENFQNELISLYFKSTENFMNSLKSICKIKGSEPLCKYYVDRDIKTLLENKVKFLKETNYLCSNKLKLCDLIYEEYDFNEFRTNLYKKYPLICNKNISKNKNLKKKKRKKKWSKLNNSQKKKKTQKN